MRPIFLKNLLTSKEVFWLYRKLVELQVWQLDGNSDKDDHPDRRHGSIAKATIIQNNKPVYSSLDMGVYGQSIPYRVNERLKEHRLEIPTNVERFWINASFAQSRSLWPHQDKSDSTAFSIVLFLCPVWNEQWLGSFFCGGEEFKFSPGGAVVFQSTEMHTGDNPSLDCPYLRLTASILTRKN